MKTKAVMSAVSVLIICTPVLQSSATECKVIGHDFTTITTGNHHCSSGCRGEPTRTNYVIELPVIATPYRYVNPKLECIAGPCGAWNQIIDVDVVWGGRAVRGSFDVWSHKTTWKLSADVEECSPLTWESARAD